MTGARVSSFPFDGVEQVPVEREPTTPWAEPTRAAREVAPEILEGGSIGAIAVACLTSSGWRAGREARGGRC